MAMTGAIVPSQGCLVILMKTSSIQRKAKINIYTLQRRKESHNTTLEEQRAETKFMGEMKKVTADGQIHLCSLKHAQKTVGTNGEKCGKRPCTKR